MKNTPPRLPLEPRIKRLLSQELDLSNLMVFPLVLVSWIFEA